MRCLALWFCLGLAVVSAYGAPVHVSLKREAMSRKLVARAAAGHPAYVRLLEAARNPAPSPMNRAAPSLRALLEDEEPLSGCPFADFSVAVRVGQTDFRLLLDTGSATLAVAGSACATCNGISPLWSPSGASTQLGGVSARGAYGDGSGWEADVWRDTVAFVVEDPTAAPAAEAMRLAVIRAQTGFGGDGSPDPFAMPFFVEDYCADSAPDAPDYPYQGIIGMAFQALALDGTDAFAPRFFAQHPDLAAQFAMRLCSGSGSLWLGGVDAASVAAPPLFVALDPAEPNYWAVVPRNMFVDGESMQLTPGDFAGDRRINIVDSGTTLWELPPSVYRRVVDRLLADPVVRRVLRSAPGANFFDHSTGWCERTSDGTPWQALLRELPTISLQLDSGLTLTMDGVGSYLLPCDSSYSEWTPGIAPSDMGMIGGWPLMNQFVTVHDVAGRRIGFAPARGCPREALRANVSVIAGSSAPEVGRAALSVTSSAVQATALLGGGTVASLTAAWLMRRL